MVALHFLPRHLDFVFCSFFFSPFYFWLIVYWFLYNALHPTVGIIAIIPLPSPNTSSHQHPIFPSLPLSLSKLFSTITPQASHMPAFGLGLTRANIPSSHLHPHSLSLPASYFNSPHASLAHLLFSLSIPKHQSLFGAT